MPEQFWGFQLVIPEEWRAEAFGRPKRASDPENRLVYPRFRVFPGGCAVCQRGQAHFKMARPSYPAGVAPGLDSIAAALSIAGAVLGPGHRSRTRQTCLGLPGGDGTISRRGRDVRGWRIAEACAHRAIVRPHP